MLARVQFQNMTLLQRERSSFARSILDGRLWRVGGPFKDESGYYWRAGRIKTRSSEAAERVVSRYNRRMTEWAEKKFDRALNSTDRQLQCPR